MASVNDMGFNQVSAVLNSIYKQALGVTETTAITNTRDFISVANTVLKAGFDPLMNAISQYLSRTIFAVRPYDEKFQILQADSIRYGNHVRKINYLYQDFVDENAMKLVDGQSIDQYTVRLPKVVQTNFYGQNGYSDYTTVSRKDLELCMSGPEEMSAFFSNMMTSISNKQKIARESMARTTIANMVAGKTLADTTNVIHLLTEYNTLTGLSLTGESIYQPENFRPFMQWLYSRIGNISDLMTEDSVIYHMNLEAGDIPRHTPVGMQRMIMNSQFVNMMLNMGVSNTFRPDWLSRISYEKTNYWQNINDPMEISIAPTYMNASGALVQGATQTVSNIIGVIYDWDAMGITTVRERVNNTPYNAGGDYYNVWWGFDIRYWNDFTENCVVLKLD